MGIHNPLHPGLSIKEMFGIGEDITVTEAASLLGVTRRSLSYLINGKSSLSVEMALRIEKVFGGTADIFIKMQAEYSLWQAKHSLDLSQLKKYESKVA